MFWDATKTWNSFSRGKKLLRQLRQGTQSFYFGPGAQTSFCLHPKTPKMGPPGKTEKETKHDKKQPETFPNA